MKQLTTISSSSKQSIYFQLEDGSIIHFTFLFEPRQQAWFMNLESEKFNVYGIQLCCHLNILDKYHNIINYGVSISTDDGFDPWRITDFEDGYAAFCVLNATELKETTEFLNGE